MKIISRKCTKKEIIAGRIPIYLIPSEPIIEIPALVTVFPGNHWYDGSTSNDESNHRHVSLIPIHNVKQ